MGAHELIIVLPDSSFGTSQEVYLPVTPTPLAGLFHPCFEYSRPLPSSDTVLSNVFKRKCVSDSTGAAYITAYENFIYTHPEASAMYIDSLDAILADFVDEEYINAPRNASPKKLKIPKALSTIAVPNSEKKPPRASRGLRSRSNNISPHPSALWTSQMDKTIAQTSFRFKSTPGWNSRYSPVRRHAPSQ